MHVRVYTATVAKNFNIFYFSSTELCNEEEGLDNFSLTNLSKPPCNGQGQSRAVLAAKDDKYDSNYNSVNYSIFVKGYHRQAFG